MKIDPAWTFDIQNNFAVIMYGKYSLIAKHAQQPTTADPNIDHWLLIG